MQPSQQTIEQFNQKYKEVLMNNLISFEPSNDWYRAAENALLFTTAFKLGLPAYELFDVFKKLEAKSKELSLYEFALANNALNDCTFNDLKRVVPSATQYFEIQVESEAMSRLWNDQSKILYAEVEREIMNTENPLKGMRAISE